MNARLAVVLACGAVIALLAVACTDTGEGIAQPDPNANSAIINQYIYGEPRGATSLWYFDVDTDGSIFFGGLVNGENRIGRISPDGELEWTRSFEGIRSLSLIPSPFDSDEKALIAAGGVDTTGDGVSDFGRVSVFSRSGELSKQWAIARPGFTLRINAVRPISAGLDQSRFFIAGGSKKDDIGHPFAAIVSIGADSTITIERDTILMDRADQFFWRAAYNGNESSPRFYVTCIPASGSDAVLCFDESLGIVWARSIQGGSDQERAHDMTFGDGTIFIVGETKVIKNAEEWCAGYVVSIGENGEFNWSKTEALSAYSDSYWGCCLYNGSLCAVGGYSECWWVNVNRWLGFGIVSLFNVESGEAIAHRTFGNKKYLSSFNHVVTAADRLILGGYTNEWFDNYGFQGWLVMADIDPANGLDRELEQINVDAASCKHRLPRDGETAR
jgi:hypothetical protein